jgi:hypothetical protein
MPPPESSKRASYQPNASNVAPRRGTINRALFSALCGLLVFPGAFFFFLPRSPNLSCRYFTHATETIIWAASDKKSRHTVNYKLIKEINRGKQMKSKASHAKALALLERILLASSQEGDLVLDPSGSSTTALASEHLYADY